MNIPFERAIRQEDRRFKPLPNQRGFTLLELILTMALIVILISLAVPSYNFVTARAQRAEMIADINKIAQALERYYTANRSYTTDFARLNMAAPAPAPGNTNTLELTSENGAATYKVTATSSVAGASCTPAPSNAATPASGCDQFTITGAPTANANNTWTLSLNNLGTKTRQEGTSNELNGWPD